MRWLQCLRQLSVLQLLLSHKAFDPGHSNEAVTVCPLSLHGPQGLWMRHGTGRWGSKGPPDGLTICVFRCVVEDIFGLCLECLEYRLISSAFVFSIEPLVSIACADGEPRHSRRSAPRTTAPLIDKADSL